MKLFYSLIDKRRTGFPLAYLTGIKEFWSIPFEVTPGVLIPRPETELVVEKTVLLSSQEREIILDVGTGCGNIAISIARELPGARIIASDISRKALKTAQRNAIALKVDNVFFTHGDLFSAFEGLGLQESCDFIVSNPPYVSVRDWQMLQSEIKEHEPKEALIAGETGLEMINKLVKESLSYLKPGGYFVCEIGDGQKEEVCSMFKTQWQNVRCHKDLGGILRVIIAERS